MIAGLPGADRRYIMSLPVNLKMPALQSITKIAYKLNRFDVNPHRSYCDYGEAPQSLTVDDIIILDDLIEEKL